MDVVLGLTPDGDAEAEEVERLLTRLRAELRGLDIDALHLRPDSTPPEGAKAVDPVTVGAVVLALSAPGGALVALVGTLQDWLSRQSAANRISITIDDDTVELEHATPDERRQLIELFVHRHRSGE
ncbi:hypothetical protein [Streptomyces sp. NPDC020607]|uniref:effector-associated constant component EACC1 n=1 Tax=Streptomyces sp. NPDC020607 TaxID=3365082 RepID=UPI0037A28D91